MTILAFIANIILRVVFFCCGLLLLEIGMDTRLMYPLGAALFAVIAATAKIPIIIAFIIIFWVIWTS